MIEKKYVNLLCTTQQLFTFVHGMFELVVQL